MPDIVRERFQTNQRVRLKDVAKLAGCGPATVSRALNNPDVVSPDKRARIEQAMSQLGYVRNHAARALRSQRSNMVGILIPTLKHAIYARMVSAAQNRLSEMGISTLIAAFDFDLDKEVLEARKLVECGAEALIMVGEKHRPEIFDLLKKFNIPFINTYAHDPNSPNTTVGFDNYLAAAKIVQHLVDIGHERFGLISGITKENDRTTQRLQGIRNALSSHGIRLPDQMIVEQSYSFAGGREGCARLLSDSDTRPTAIICGNDILAIGALRECASRRLKVPEDVSIVGFDNLSMAAYVDPALTTLDVPAEEMGSVAAQTILGKLDGADSLEHHTVDVELVIRDSAAAPRK